jgi:hypothetical protein
VAGETPVARGQQPMDCAPGDRKRQNGSGRSIGDSIDFCLWDFMEIQWEFNGNFI